MSKDVLLGIIRQLATLPSTGHLPRKVNFAGGEPLMHPDLPEALELAHALGLQTSIITNGQLIDRARIAYFASSLDMVGISVDSLNAQTNRRIGRCCGNAPMDAESYHDRIRILNEFGLKLKINTVVNSANVDEDFSPFLLRTRPFRWKILQCTRMESENGKTFQIWETSDKAFDNFVERHTFLKKHGITIVPENQNALRASYAIIDPDGRFVDNSTGTYRYSRLILDIGIENAFQEVQFSDALFRERGGNYDLRKVKTSAHTLM